MLPFDSVIFGLRGCIVWKGKNVSEESTASISEWQSEDWPKIRAFENGDSKFFRSSVSYQPTRRHIPEDCDVRTYNRQKHRFHSLLANLDMFKRLTQTEGVDCRVLGRIFGYRRSWYSRITSTKSPPSCMTTFSASLTTLRCSYLSHMIAATTSADEHWYASRPLTAETHRSMGTRNRLLSRLVTSAQAR